MVSFFSHIYFIALPVIVLVPGMKEGADLLGVRMKQFIEMFDIVLQRHAKHSTHDDPSQVASFRQGPKLYLEDLTPQEAQLISYIEPKAPLYFQLGQMCFTGAVSAYEEKSFSHSLSFRFYSL